MCGIGGAYSYKSKMPVNPDILADMLAAIRHRGPDDDGTYLEERLALGMRRLSIIDLAGGHQPMSNEDGSIWIVFNGEIYNFPDLRSALLAEGHVFRTRSDTETVIHAYEEWGMGCFARLNGMFGLALWDRRSQELILARDPFGIKPLYYADYQGRLVFGSEIKAILADPEIPREVDPAALDQFLAFSFVPSPRTMFMSINKVPPGYAMRVSAGGVTLGKFYESRLATQDKSSAAWLEELRDQIEAAVKRQMVADVPVGVMLSGGIDSATVATLMREISGQPVHSFTVGFAGDFQENELVQARRSAELIGTTHHEAVISADEFIEFLPKSVWHLEEPVANPSSLPFYWICRLAREHVKVVLTGQGADEPFAGYGRHLGEYYGRWYRGIPGPVRKRLLTPLVDALPRNEQLKRAVHSLDIRDPLSRLTQIYSICDADLRQRLYKPGAGLQSQASLERIVRDWHHEAQHLDSLNQMTYVDARFSLADNLLMYGDKMSMAVSLEARVPFLDLDLMAFVESMPARYKIRGWTQKYLLKKAVAKWLPPEIVHRKKIGFSTPVDQWFSKELRNYISDKLLGASSACGIYFDQAAIGRLIADHESKRHDHQRHLFNLLSFELWHELFIRKGGRE
jgi:asparagine synthase (glutamine-hydrolysing)